MQISLKKYNSLVLIYFLGLVVNVWLNLVFIPKFSYIGASWVSVGCEYFVVCLQVVSLGWYLKKIKATKGHEYEI